MKLDHLMIGVGDLDGASACDARITGVAAQLLQIG